MDYVVRCYGLTRDETMAAKLILIGLAAVVSALGMNLLSYSKKCLQITSPLYWEGNRDEKGRRIRLTTYKYWSLENLATQLFGITTEVNN